MAWSWDEMYEKATEYYNDNGDLLVPQPYVCKDGAKLGKWICTQRMVKSGRVNGILDSYRIEALEAIGMDWNPNLTAWNKGYDELEKYYIENGHIDVPLRFSTETGFRLGLWLQNQRRSYLKKGRGALNQEQINRLELLNIVWDPHRHQWLKNYANLKSYYEEHGNINLPCGYSVDGVNLYEWLGYQRATYNGVGNGVIDEEQIELLEKLEIGWENKLDIRWNDMYLKAKEYFEKYGHLNMLSTYITPDGENLGSWVFKQRLNWKDDKLENDRKELLDQIGMNWDYASKKQTSFFEQAIVYYFSKIYPDIKSRDKSYGVELDVFIPSRQVAIEYDGQLFHGDEKLESDENKNALCKKLGVTLYRIREKDCARMSDDSKNIYLKENTIPAFENALHEMISILDAGLKADIDVNRDCGEIYGQYLMVGPAISEDDSANYIISTEWMEYYNLAEQYYKEYGHLIVEKDECYQDKDLGNWIANQRHYYNSKQTQLATQKVVLLEKIGMAWNANDYKWEIGFRYAEQYYKIHGDLLVPGKYVVDDFQLGHWILNQRSKKTGRYKTTGKITELQVERLENIGMVWNSLDEKWEIMFNLAKNYYEEKGNLEVPDKCEIDGKRLGSWIQTQRENYKKGTNPNFTDKKIKRLESIGMKWEIGKGNVRPPYFDEKWEQMYILLQKELEANPAVKLTKRYVTANGVNLGQWVYRQKKVYQGKESGVLDEDKINKLKKLNII